MTGRQRQRLQPPCAPDRPGKHARLPCLRQGTHARPNNPDWSGPWRGRRRLTALPNQVLNCSNVGIIRTQYTTLRVLALRGPSLVPLSATFASRPAAPGSGAGQRRTMMPPSTAVMAGQAATPR